MCREVVGHGEEARYVRSEDLSWDQVVEGLKWQR